MRSSHLPSPRRILPTNCLWVMLSSAHAPSRTLQRVAAAARAAEPASLIQLGASASVGLCRFGRARCGAERALAVRAAFAAAHALLSLTLEQLGEEGGSPHDAPEACVLVPGRFPVRHEM